MYHLKHNKYAPEGIKKDILIRINLHGFVEPKCTCRAGVGGGGGEGVTAVVYDGESTGAHLGHTSGHTNHKTLVRSLNIVTHR